MVWRSVFSGRNRIDFQREYTKQKQINRVQRKRNAELSTRVEEQNAILRDIRIAIGRVEVLKGHVTEGSPFSGLPDLVALVASDHDDLERRIDAVVEYLRWVGETLVERGPTEVPVRVQDVRETIGRLLQGADPEIVDLQGGTDIIKEE